jgi:hypothetical protein
MGKFLAAHTLPSPATLEEAGVFAKAAKAGCSSDAYWISSWAQLNEEGKITKILCEWDAKDSGSIRQILTKISGLPVDGIYPTAKVDGESYR